jgi:serine/threonine protein phosphatase 1
MESKDLKPRTFALGDIHGAHRALIQCLERSGFNKNIDTLIHLGDVADGWSEVPQCVEELLNIPNFVPIRGNHDCWAWNWFLYGDAPDIWLEQGGRATRNAYLEQGLVNDQRHIDFWNRQNNYYITEDNKLMVHGGFSLYYGFNWSKDAQITQVRNSIDLHWNRDCSRFNTKSSPNSSYKFLDEFKEIFIGHTQHYTTDFNNPQKRNIWNLDTGCGYKGKLTIMDIDTKEYWQSDSVNTLYPNEVSR